MSRTQHLEPIVRDVLKNRLQTYYMKLQVNPLAHYKMPGDFLFITPKENFVIECKECKGTSFPFTRYTQKQELEKWSNSIWKNRGFLVIMFWKGTKKKSTYYVIEDWMFDRIMKKSTKKSVNEKDLIDFRILNYEVFKELKWLK